MSPDRRPVRRNRRTVRDVKPPRPNPDDPYRVVYFKRHPEDDAEQSMPGRDFRLSLPPKVRATMDNVLIAVAKAPPHRYSGGGYWEAMHGKMTGYHEVRVNGPSRIHYRLFCRLDVVAEDVGPLLTVLCGASKPFRTKFDKAVYEEVLGLGQEYLSRNPRSLG